MSAKDDVYPGNFKIQGQIHSNEHITHQLVYAERQSKQIQIYTDTFSASSILNSHEFIHSSRKTIKCEMLQKEMTLSTNRKRTGSIHSGTSVMFKILYMKAHFGIPFGIKEIKLLKCRKDYSFSTTITPQ
ncbi:zinc finger protein 99 [Biomphalaria pfeifferi]|uniref:Zinc finger protein 99 n=1 Tax=Biomphalaria pfeifferi TaxID=112525 RepID=A0AAD8C540_BIOPF|nr:zinc finger protein 99 [Biomphalaria pfeifferi]